MHTLWQKNMNISLLLYNTYNTDIAILYSKIDDVEIKTSEIINKWLMNMYNVGIIHLYL